MESPQRSPTSGALGGLLSKRTDAQQSTTLTSSPRGKTTKDIRPKRVTPPKLGLSAKDAPSVAGVSKWNGKSRFNSSATAKPLVPASDRISQEDKTAAWRTKRKGSDEKFDITPDGGSGGRDGRQFTVANVGNNGRIYLRPSVRPAHQRYPQPNFVFPVTPPGTAGLEAMTDKLGKTLSKPEDDTTDLNHSVWTPTPSTPATARQQYFPGHSRRPTGHRRALSDSTTPEDTDHGAFKVVITKPGDEKRPKTMEDLGPGNLPHLDVDIPTYRIGNPRFTMRGTPFFRGSSYAPTEEFPRSSNVSFLRSQNGALTPHADQFSSLKPTPNPVVPHIRLPSPDDPVKSPVFPSRLAAPYRSTYLSTHLVIEPAMFDSLTFRPACDDRAIVRYAASTGAVTAATPPRLVAEITSPTFLDYELISDFFLTYRSFLEPSDLLRMLVARLRWALARDDEVGMVVRVRTFVAMRHWILNYFMDDFVVDYGLRMSFCTLLNDFVEELSQDVRARKVQLKILAELKKCWRRVCAQFWDGPEFDTSLDASMPIAPGGIAGHRDASLDPSFWEREDSDVPPRLSGLFAPLNHQATRDDTFYADVSKAGHITDVQFIDRPATPEQRPADLHRQQTSPTSIVSLDVVSCSLPGKASRIVQTGNSHPLAAHPVPPSSVYTNTGAVATTPRALTGKRVRPTQPTHKRNGSLTDSLRDKERPTERASSHNSADLPLSFPFAGSLVRGNFLPPGQPFVEVLPPGANPDQRQTTVFQTAPPPYGGKSAASAMSGQGMKRLLGSVRRHLSTRGQGISPTQGSFLNISAIGPQGATTNRLPGTAIVPQARPRHNGARPPVRIDLLGAEIAEDFKKAVREDAAAEAERRELAFRLPAGLPLESAIPGDLLEYSAAHMDTSLPLLSPPLASPTIPDHLRPMSDTGITTGSKSIVIVDDTLPFGLPVPMPMSSMHGALSSLHDSVEAFGDHLVPNNADPTPPTTPPGRPLDVTRRSSYVLNQHAMRPSITSDRLPPFVPDLATLGHGRPSEDATRPSIDTTRRSEVPEAPVNRHQFTASVRKHRRGLSSRTNQSLNSILHRRANSLQSAWAKRSTIRSFDATTYSDSASVFHDDDDDDEEEAQSPVPRPLRVLRRRPGGNLRAATNIGDLDALPLRKSRSLASLTTYSESIKSSFLRGPQTHESIAHIDVASSDFSPGNQQTFSLGAMAEQQPAKRPISLFSTHSSKPIMRPSFEAEAKKLAQIPDDEDGGGVESALAKLEGTYEKKSFKLSMEPTNAPLVFPKEPEAAVDSSAVDDQEKKEHRHLHIGDGEEAFMEHEHDHHHGDADADVSAQDDVSGLQIPRTRPQTEQRSFLSDNSGVSYSSVPLLDRGLTDDGRSKTATNEWRDRSVLFGPDDPSPSPTPRQGGSYFDSQHPSYDFIQKTESMERMKAGDTMPPSSANQSFLDDESDDDTELSSELSDIPGQEDHNYSAAAAFPARASSIAPKTLPAHPLAISTTSRDSNPPSPPISLVQALRMSPETANIPQVHEHQIWSRKPLPPTPETTPTAPQHSEEGQDQIRAGEADLSKKYSVHLPFILAFDSETLAQQFTLIEKDALNEIDWKELIEMSWKNAANNDSRSWVDFLRNSDAHGVEVVIARFNIMVKWACSQIVLTQDIEERVRCIIKFIHIAAHCRKYRNFATMSQITIALTSQEVGRLAKTWAMVPHHDMQTLQDLETLVAPMRNFHNLRAEMEGGSDLGCIPFVGIYTHDLLFNAQRPSEIASSPTTAPLVNFERCRYAATIVKTLLRLLEASTLYHFQPIEGITERCLWMSALTDEQIRQRSQSLE